MRWQVLLQAAIGVGALYAFAYIAVERKVAPLAEQESFLRATAEARVGALEVERAWGRSRAALESAAVALARSPTFSSLGQVLPADRRNEGLARALDGAVEQIGGEGRAALFDGKGRTLVGAASLANTGAVRDARLGAVSIRVEWLDQRPYEVAAVPLLKPSSLEGKTPRGEGPRGVLALARLLEKTRLGSWTRSLPLTTSIVILDGREPVTSLLPADQLGPISALRLPHEVVINGKRHALSEHRLVDDGATELRVVALAPVVGPQGIAVLSAVRVLVLGLAIVSFLLTSALLMLVPPTTAAAASEPGSVETMGPPFSPSESLVAPAPSPSPFHSPAVPASVNLGAQAPAPLMAPLDQVEPLPPPAASPPPAVNLPPSLGYPEPVAPSLARAASVRPDAAGTYSGVPVASSETLPQMGPDIDAGPHSSGNRSPISSLPPPESAFNPPSSLTGLPSGAFDGFTAGQSSTPPDLRATAEVRGPPVPPSSLANSLSEPAPGGFGSGDANLSSSFGRLEPEGLSATGHNRDEDPSSYGHNDGLVSSALFGGNGEVPEPLAADQRVQPGLGAGHVEQASSSSMGLSSQAVATPSDAGYFGEAVPPPSELNAPATSLSADIPNFDAIARAAHVAPPPVSASGGPSDDNGEDLLVPKGGLSPGMIAAQGLAPQGRVMAPSPRLEENLPLPKEQASHLYDLSPKPPAAFEAAASAGPSADLSLDRPPERTGPRGAPGLRPKSSEGSTELSADLNTAGGLSAPSTPSTDIAQPFDTSHYRQVFDEFVAAKSKLGESVEGLSFEGFGAKLRASEEGLIQKHACRAVRFQVLVKDRSVSLRPQLVR